jgi:nucleoside phosphorylase
MEAAAIAYVCELAAVPFFAIKVVTDIVDGDRTTQEV